MVSLIYDSFKQRSSNISFLNNNFIFSQKTTKKYCKFYLAILKKGYRVENTFK